MKTKAEVLRRSSPVRRRAAVAALAAALSLAGCDYLPWGYTHVKDIVAAPGKFEGTEVKLKGRVRSTHWVLGIKAYTLREETGEITVVTDGTLPEQNEEVRLKGVVRTTAIIGGGWTVGLRVEEMKRLR
jgi:hypothetical protein